MLYEMLFAPPEQSTLKWGSIGWDDEDDYMYLGEEDEDDGHTLVRVQLFDGRDHTQPLKDRAQGHKIICHINSLAGMRVPPKDTRVLVAIPPGMENTPGGGMIIGAAEKLPRKAGNVKADEVVILGRGKSQARIVAKEDGRVAIMTTAGNAQGGKAVALVLGPDGFQFTSPWGSMRFDSTGFHVKTKAGPAMHMGGMAVPGLPSDIAGAITGYFTIDAPVITAKGDIVNLGRGPVYGYVGMVQQAQYPVPGTTFATFTPALNASPSVRVSFP